MEEMLLQNLWGLTIGFVAFFGGLLTIYYKLKGSFEKAMEDAINTKLSKLDSEAQLRLQALDMKYQQMEEVNVKREDLVQVKAELKSLSVRLNDIHSLMKQLLDNKQ